MIKMKTDDHGEEYNPYCYFHPKEVKIGICALCLNEKLLNLELKQDHVPIPKDSSTSSRTSRRKPSFSIPNAFPLGSFLRVDTRHRKSSSDHGSISSLEDSFISIKFENNGEASWKTNKQKVFEEQQAKKSLVHHGMQKRISQLLRLARWNIAGKAGGARNAGLVGKAEGRRGWMRRLTKRRTID